MGRLKGLDFLRGIAILLIFFRHQKVEQYSYEVAWVGLELFLVLSGFLVSGLVFKEYKRFGNLKISHFLIRRGFKIYPIYYLSFIPYYFFVKWNNGSIEWDKWWAEAVFIQNYYNGYGYLHFSSWSLALEEHFYLGLALIFGYFINVKMLKIEQKPISILITILIVQISALVFRFNSYELLDHGNNIKPFTFSHHRIDSIMAGVLVSYFFYFHHEAFKNWFFKYKNWLNLGLIFCLIWTPFVPVVKNQIAFSLGISLAYSAVVIVLLNFLFRENFYDNFSKTISEPVAKLISKIGVYSFPSYIFHIMVNNLYYNITKENSFFQQNLVAYICTSTISLTLGYIISIYIDEYFIKLRDKYYPSRSY